MSVRLLSAYYDALERGSCMPWSGRVVQVTGSVVESEGPYCSVGECCEILTHAGERLLGEIVGFNGSRVLSMPLRRPEGIRYGDRVVATGSPPAVGVGDRLLGRVIDAEGRPLDGSGPCRVETQRAVDGSAPLPMERVAIREPLGCGVRAIDAFLTCGRGQRMGIFGGSGVGKSTLIGMMARGTSADLTVVALIGERGREVREFLEDALGGEGRQRSVVVVSTSDQSPLLKLRAAHTATAVAEHFCGQGRHVLLVVDSLTRYAMAQRDVGLAAGEPPTAKGYTPSVFSLLPRLIERAGYFGRGSITGFYTVLMEGDDQQDPLVDAARSFLDGHIMLDRKLAIRNQYPPIAVLDSLSRLMPSVCSKEQMDKVRTLRTLLSEYERSEDLIRIGAYQKGSDRLLDEAIALVPRIEEFLRQGADERPGLQQSIDSLLQLNIG